MPDNSTWFDQLTRRHLVRAAGSALVTIAALPSSAKGTVAEQEVTGGVLNVRERAGLAAFGDTLLPGAKGAGIVRYVERQLQSETPLLFLRYLDYTDNCLAFYKAGLKALEAYSVSQFGMTYTELSHQQQEDLVIGISRTTPPDWNGPPSTLFYFVVRNDATDVFYGTEDGFRRLDVPYLALLAPPRKW